MTFHSAVEIELAGEKLNFEGVIPRKLSGSVKRLQM
jgi:hypothetical protein